MTRKGRFAKVDSSVKMDCHDLLRKSRNDGEKLESTF